MKTKFTKNIFSIITIVCFILNSQMIFAQWTQPLGINGAVGALRVTSSGGSVAGNNAYAGAAFYGTNDIGQAALNGDIDATFNAIGPGFRFKATAGKPDTITIEIALNVFAPYFENTITATNKVISPAYAVYKAGKSISFGPGFEARSGSLFAAQIGECN